MRILDVLAAVLVVIGGLNWGLIGVADLNLVQAIFGDHILTRIIYILVGLAAVYQIVSIKGIQSRWGSR
jgi:uncharacterized membrane protein YuzA (DUF378 family)